MSFCEMGHLAGLEEFIVLEFSASLDIWLDKVVCCQLGIIGRLGVRLSLTVDLDIRLLVLVDDGVVDGRFTATGIDLSLRVDKALHLIDDFGRPSTRDGCSAYQ